MSENSLSLWMERRYGSRKKDRVIKLIERKHSSDEKLANDGW